jgi:hypothetical protein
MSADVGEFKAMRTRMVLGSQISWASSEYRQKALAIRIWSGVRQSASKTLGEATRTQMHCAREVATLSRFKP